MLTALLIHAAILAGPIGQESSDPATSSVYAADARDGLALAQRARRGGGRWGGGRRGDQSPGDSAAPQSRSAHSGRSDDAGDGHPGLGKGIFIQISSSRGIFPGAFEEVQGNPHVAGVQVSLVWAELEPQKGQYRWKEIDEVLDQYGKVGKQVAFKFGTAGPRVPTPGQISKGRGKAGENVEFRNTGTPEWLWEDRSVARVGGIDTPAGKLPYYPVFWDEGYLKHLEDFIAAFAERYDGDPRIEYIRMGGWQIGTNEPSFYGGASQLLKDQLAREGETWDSDLPIPRLTSDSKYCQSILTMIDLWHEHFKKTRLACTIHMGRGRDTIEAAMNDHCIKTKTVMLETRLNERDRRNIRTYFRQVHDEHGVKVGWGGISNLGIRGGEEEVDADLGGGMLGEALREGIGSDTDERYEPASRVSYLVFGLNGLEDRELLGWAAEQLVP